MAIRASFEFEKNFYEKCKESPLSADQIEKLSIVAQEKSIWKFIIRISAVCLDEICSVLFSRCSFYNYPYTFGYLASFSLLEIAKRKEKYFSLEI